MAKDDEIRDIAYKLWEEEGRPDGKDVEHWFKAETIWQERQNQASASFIRAPEPEKTAKASARTKKSRR